MRHFGLTSRETIGGGLSPGSRSVPDTQHAPNVIKFKSASAATPALGQTTQGSQPADFIWGADFKRRSLLVQTAFDVAAALAWLVLGIVFSFSVGALLFCAGLMIFFS